MINEFDQGNNKEKPRVFVDNITFNDGTKLMLQHNSVVVFVGANNVGKSQVLKDIEQCLDGANSAQPVVVSDCKFNYYGDITEEGFLADNFTVNEQGKYKMNQYSNSLDLGTLQSFWNQKNLTVGLYKLFINLLNTEKRLTESNEIELSSNIERHPIYKLARNDNLCEIISQYFHQAFNEDLVISRYNIKNISLHVGMAPNTKDYTMDKQNEYYKLVDKLPKLQVQGDGMRSYASILLDAFTSEYPITLIDEPEAFLHQPQARLIGNVLAENNHGDRQLFIATHSVDLLQGLLDADCDNVTVIRIDRRDSINRMSVLDNSKIKELWSNPILKYSNILSGLFYEKVVVCESDYDCLFYHALINAMCEKDGRHIPNILFVYCGGKQRAKDMAGPLIAINVPVMVICDFDILNENDPSAFIMLAQALGIDYKDILLPIMGTLYESIKQRDINGEVWKELKVNGKGSLTEQEKELYNNIELICQSAGLFIVPVGEIESFDKSIKKHKKNWVFTILEEKNLGDDPELTEARSFMKALLDYSVVK